MKLKATTENKESSDRITVSQYDDWVLRNLSNHLSDLYNKIKLQCQQMEDTYDLWKLSKFLHLQDGTDDSRTESWVSAVNVSNSMQLPGRNLRTSPINKRQVQRTFQINGLETENQ